MPRGLRKAFVTALVALTLGHGCDDSAEQKRARVERERVEAARQVRLQIRQTEECNAVKQALPAIAARGRIDLVETPDNPDSCLRLRNDGCDFKVEFLYTLANSDAVRLVSLIDKIGDDCTAESNFANKWGLEAFREHRKLLQDATQQSYDQGLDEGRDEAHNDGADDVPE